MLLTETQFGHVWVARLGLLAGLAVMLLRPPSRGRDQLALIAAAGLLGALAFSGHSGSRPGLPGMFYAGADVVHLLAAGAWVGGLLPLALLLNRALHGDRRDREQAKLVTQRFSILGIVCVGALLATGIVNTWNLVGSVEALLDTGYGQLLLLKIAVFALMVSLAAANRYRFTPRMSERGGMLSLWRNTMIETGLGALALGAVGILGTIPPGSHGGHAHDVPQIPEGAAFVHIHAEPAMADVTVMPGRAGLLDITIRLMRDDFTLLPARSVALQLSRPAEDAPPRSFVATETSLGYWRVGPVSLTPPGVWTVELDIGLGENRTVTLDGPLVLEP
jgi:putative copper export protein